MTEGERIVQEWDEAGNAEGPRALARRIDAALAEREAQTTVTDRERALAFVKDYWAGDEDHPSLVNRIAVLIAAVRAEERERCAQALDERVVDWKDIGGCADQIEEAQACAAAIRALPRRGT